MSESLFPKRVDLNQASIDQLQQLFEASTGDLQGYLQTLNGGTVSKSTVANVKTQVQQRLTQLGVDVGSWVSTSVPQQYITGMGDMANQQASFGQDAAAALIIGLISHIASSRGLPTPPIVQEAKTGTDAKIISPPQKMYDLHNQSIQGIMDSMGTSFGESLSAMNRSADQAITKVQALDIRRQIATSASTGVDTSHIQKQITSTLNDNGITALVDSAGRNWNAESYVNMLVRTKLTEARNYGMMNAQMSAGNDLVEVSSHGAQDVCADWEGQILSISGNDSNYPSVDDATGDGLFHPNCQHSLNAVDPDTYPSEASLSYSDFPTDISTEDVFDVAV